MFKGAILALALVLPAAAVHADDMFRWRDGRGRLHYSNDSERIPEGAKPVTAKLGEIGGAPIGPAVQPEVAEGERVARWPANTATACARRLGVWALPHRSVDLDRPDWYYVDAACGRQHDIEAWLRGAATALEFRKIGL